MTESSPHLNEPPEEYYNFHHSIVNTAPASRAIVLWNLLDFPHVNWVHRRNYAYCKVLAETNRTHLLEYGVRMFFFLHLRWSTPLLMWHEFVPPNIVRHLSRSPWGTYTKVEMILEESEKNGQIETRLIHRYATRLSPLMRLLKGLFTWYLNAWSDQLWKEDEGILLRRIQVLKAGFKDHPLDLTPRAAEGLGAMSKSS